MIVPGHAHKPYYFGGKKVPSVTTVLGIVSKPYLLQWANNLGLKGTTIEENRAYITGIGQIVHSQIESVFRGENVDLRGFSEKQIKVSNGCFEKFALWSLEHDIISHGVEISMSSEKYGGTLDAILTIDGVPTIVDWKTSMKMEKEYFSQLSAYYFLLQRNPEKISLPEIKNVAVLRLPKENDEIEFVTIPVDSKLFKTSWEYFSAALSLYYAKTNLLG